MFKRQLLYNNKMMTSEKTIHSVPEKKSFRVQQGQFILATFNITKPLKKVYIQQETKIFNKLVLMIKER